MSRLVLSSHEFYLETYSKYFSADFNQRKPKASSLNLI